MVQRTTLIMEEHQYWFLSYERQVVSQGRASTTHVSNRVIRGQHPLDWLVQVRREYGKDAWIERGGRAVMIECVGLG